MAKKKKTTKSKTTTKAKTAPKKHWYLHQRDHFFENHPSARILLGLFIVAFAIFIGKYYYNLKLQVALGDFLGQEGIVYNPDL